MNRQQVSMMHAKGKIIQEVIFTRGDDKVLIALNDAEFVIIRARQCYDEHAEIEHEVNSVEFCRHEYSTEDLAKVFDINTMSAFADEDAKHEADQRKRTEERERKEFEKLKAKFGG